MDEHREMKVTPDRYVTYRYAGASGDFNPIHLDDEFARSVGLPGRILHGLWTMAQVARAQGDGLKLESLSVQFRGMGVPEQEITVTSSRQRHGRPSRPCRARTASSGAGRPSSANDVVAARGDLRDLPALVPGLGRRRRRRPARDRRAAAVPALAGRRRDLADADLPVAAARLRLRHHRSHGDRPAFGSLADFDALVARAHELGLRVLLDYVPNHTSDQHPWFRDPAKRDWYLWHDGTPPNNWISVFGGPAWEHDPATGRSYYHAYLREQPDLNWRNPAVREAMLGVLEFWIARGVDGFRVDAMRQLLKDPRAARQPAGSRLPRGHAGVRLAAAGPHGRPRRGAGGRGRHPARDRRRPPDDRRGLRADRAARALLRRGRARRPPAAEHAPDLDARGTPRRSRRWSSATRPRCRRARGRTGCSATTTARGSPAASGRTRRAWRRCCC